MYHVSLTIKLSTHVTSLAILSLHVHQGHCLYQEVFRHCWKEFSLTTKQTCSMNHCYIHMSCVCSGQVWLTTMVVGVVKMLTNGFRRGSLCLLKTAVITCNTSAVSIRAPKSRDGCMGVKPPATCLLSRFSVTSVSCVHEEPRRLTLT